MDLSVNNKYTFSVTQYVSSYFLEKMAKRPVSKPSAVSKQKRRDSFYDEVELALSEALGTKVKVYNGRNKGTLEIDFYTLEDLKNIANAIAK